MSRGGALDPARGRGSTAPPRAGSSPRLHRAPAHLHGSTARRLISTPWSSCGGGAGRGGEDEQPSRWPPSPAGGDWSKRLQVDSPARHHPPPSAGAPHRRRRRRHLPLSLLPRRSLPPLRDGASSNDWDHAGA
jgi:hypothetical protein